MIKKKTKIKELRRMSNGDNLYFVEYCKLQCLLKNVEPEYYYSNVYGWRFDVYLVNGLIITTGYEMPRISFIKELKEVKKFENLAHDIYRSNIKWQEKEKELKKLLEEFCKINGGF